MGGGAVSFSDFDKEDYFRRRKELEDNADRDKYEYEVEEFIRGRLSFFNNRDTETIKTHLQNILDAISSSQDFDGSLKLIFGGSISKNTFLNGISDADCLVVLNNSDLVNDSPRRVLKHFKELLQKRLPNTEIEISTKSLTVKYSDIDVQLLPSIRTSKGLRIIDSEGKNWSNVVRPGILGGRLTVINKELKGKFIPTIKAIKAIFSNQPEKRQLSGYHVETLGAQVFRDYKGPIRVKEMIKFFFKNAPEKILTPLKDPSGQSQYVDTYLGKRNDLRRRLTYDSLKRISREIDFADETMQSHFWKSNI